MPRVSEKEEARRRARLTSRDVRRFNYISYRAQRARASSRYLNSADLSERGGREARNKARLRGEMCDVAQRTQTPGRARDRFVTSSRWRRNLAMRPSPIIPLSSQTTADNMLKHQILKADPIAAGLSIPRRNGGARYNPQCIEKASEEIA